MVFSYSWQFYFPDKIMICGMSSCAVQVKEWLPDKIVTIFTIKLATNNMSFPKSYITFFSSIVMFYDKPPVDMWGCCWGRAHHKEGKMTSVLSTWWSISRIDLYDMKTGTNIFSFLGMRSYIQLPYRLSLTKMMNE